MAKFIGLPIAFILFLMVTARAAILGTDKCTWGPSYWCSSVETANACKTFSFCLENEWNQQPPKEQKNGDKNFRCDECMILVQYLRDLDRNSDVQNAVVNFFDNICFFLEDQKQQCKNLVKQYSQQLFEIVASELEPKVGCEFFLHCTQPEAALSKNDSSLPFVAESKVFSKNPESSQALPAVYSSEKPGKNLSHAVKSRPEWPSYQNKETLGESVECAICQLVIEIADEFIAENRTQQSLQMILDMVCDLFPSTIKASCIQFVQTYAPALIDLLLQELDPQLVCDELRVCNDTKSRHLSLKLKTADNLKVSAEPECAICKLVVQTLDIYLKSNRSEAAIEKALEEVCTLFPPTISGECQAFLEKNAPSVINLIILKIDPDKICKILKLCNSAYL